MKISEPIFVSIQGEGRFIGTPSIFIRTSGCNMRCSFCDTKYSWDTCIESDLSELSNFDCCKHLVITGGEPMMWQKDIQQKLVNLDKYEIEIETNGTIKPELKGKIYYSVSPKLKNSGNKDAIKIDVLKEYAKLDSIFKFVAVSKDDFREIDEIVSQLNLKPDKIYIMPEGINDAEIRKHGLELISGVIKRGYKLTPRLQIFLFGNKRGV